MSEKVIYLPPNSTSKISKIVIVWGSTPDPARGAYVSSTIFFSRPTTALSRQPPRLFSLVTSCRPHSAFQRSTYDYSIISSFVQFCPKHACCIPAHVQMLRYLLTYSAPPYTQAALRWNGGRVQRAYSWSTIQLNPFSES